MVAYLLPLLLSITLVANGYCNNAYQCYLRYANGSLTLGAVTGGIAPYTYSVDGSPFTATLVYNNLAAGTHTIDVRDANGCVFATTAAISNTTGQLLSQ